MPLTTLGRNALLDSGKAGITHIGAFTDLGATEVSGGSYARVAVTWTTAASGVTDNNAQLTINIPAGVTVPALGFFSASTAGNNLGYWPVGSAGQVVIGAGSVESTTTDVIRSNGHGLVDTDRVFVSTLNNEALRAR